jgi:hypothetical protein
MERRLIVPDIPRKADEVIEDLRSDPGDTGQGRLDAISTMTGLTEDDLKTLVLEVAGRLDEDT